MKWSTLLALLLVAPAFAQTNKDVTLQAVEVKVIACDFCVTLNDSTPAVATVYLGQGTDTNCNSTTKVCATNFVSNLAIVDTPTTGQCDHAAVTKGRVRATIDPLPAQNKNGYQLEMCAADLTGGYHCCDGKVLVQNVRLFPTLQGSGVP